MKSEKRERKEKTKCGYQNTKFHLSPLPLETWSRWIFENSIQKLHPNLGYWTKAISFFWSLFVLNYVLSFWEQRFDHINHWMEKSSHLLFKSSSSRCYLALELVSRLLCGYHLDTSEGRKKYVECACDSGHFRREYLILVDSNQLSWDSPIINQHRDNQLYIGLVLSLPSCPSFFFLLFFFFFLSPFSFSLNLLTLLTSFSFL